MWVYKTRTLPQMVVMWMISDSPRSSSILGNFLPIISTIRGNNVFIKYTHGV